MRPKKLRYRVTLELTQPLPPESVWESRMTKGGIRRAFNSRRWSFEDFTARVRVLEISAEAPE